MNAPLNELLTDSREALLGWLASRAGWILRYESAEDLAQGATVRALKRGGSFRYEGEERFRAWLFRVALSYLADRPGYWTALKRHSAALLRLSEGGTSGGPGTPVAPPPASPRPGPSTHADRREMLTLAVQVLATLPERDAKLLRWASEGVPLREQAERLGLGYEAAKKAGQRALERFREAWRFASGY